MAALHEIARQYADEIRDGCRYEVCQECGLDWNVSKQAVIPWYGYKCPICRSKYRKGAKP